MSKYKTTVKQTLFDAENAAQKLSEIGNPLEKLDSVIDFEMFSQPAGGGDGEPQHQEQCRSEAVRCGDDVQSDGLAPVLQPQL